MTTTRDSAPTLLEVNDLHARYGDARVLHGVSLRVAEGEVVVLLGANGAGKSTLLKALSGLVDRSGGVTFDGADISGEPSARIVRRGLVLVPEGRGTFADLTVEENLRLGAYPTAATRSEVAASSDEIMTMFPILGERSTQRAGLLSGGEQQMLAIGRALMARPRMLLLDEPSLGLAPAVTKSVFETLRTLHEERGLSLLIVEQNAELSLGIADYAYVIEAGLIRVDGPARSIRDNEGLRRAYLGY
ncbi:ABC transporter ATP-binding protein [Herbiconiux sp. CPCC 203407]|uniref:ABC transporter ATP-binding protein n=1 Tax=Herbiconiux oxytropis TaxID=2970915 RepID=A0AA41XK98_9MICO|nr:ABC transporter ATP-binding protein [Herbiconiux oxytropis]MCS5723223.1 ABC transporter ATP-binding protein [Herbiconiux oxytropis]MCS5727878.1 ABC transporter ATP-binding protein [Herbiconiux oxytropis]